MDNVMSKVKKKNNYYFMSKVDSIIGILDNTRNLLLNEEDVHIYNILKKAVDELKQIKNSEIGYFIDTNFDPMLIWAVCSTLDKNPYSVDATKLIYTDYHDNGLTFARACTLYIQENLDWYKSMIY